MHIVLKWFTHAMAGSVFCSVADYNIFQLFSDAWNWTSLEILFWSFSKFKQLLTPIPEASVCNINWN